MKNILLILILLFGKAFSQKKIPDFIGCYRGAEQGGVTVTPGANTDKVDITYSDEDDKPHTITVTNLMARSSAKTASSVAVLSDFGMS